MKATIKNIIRETLDVKTFILDLEKELEFKSGQFISIKIPLFEKPRPFSISSCGGKTKEITITAKIYDTGSFTSNLDKMKIGEKIEFEGPYGKLFFDKSIKENIVLICAGTGISTLHSIMLHIINNKLPNKAKVIYSIKKEENIIYKKELNNLNKERKIDYFLTVTNDKNWKGNKERINKDILKKYDRNSKFYIVGPNKFVKDIFEILINLNIKKEDIKMEIYGE